MAKHLQELQKENSRLKKLVADQALDMLILKEAAGHTLACRRSTYVPRASPPCTVSTLLAGPPAASCSGHIGTTMTTMTTSDTTAAATTYQLRAGGERPRGGGRSRTNLDPQVQAAGHQSRRRPRTEAKHRSSGA